MRLWKTFLVSACSVTLVSAGVIAASAASSTSSNVKYSACLNRSSKTLSNVTISGVPKCPPSSTVIIWNAQGPKGAAGPEGIPGVRGSLWSTGTTSPTSTSTQQNGDLYLDTATGNIYELVTSAWTLEGNTKGVAGSPGSPGVAGPSGANGARGSLWSTGTGVPSISGAQQSGDLYLDTATENVYEVVSGVWVLQDNIQGPAGANGVAYDCSASPYPGVNYDGCDFNGAAYPNVNLFEAQFAGADLVASFLYAGSHFDNANFTGADISSSYLYDSATFVNANFTGANLSHSFLYSGGDFTNANFTGANLSSAHLYSGGIFTNANFTGANLTGAVLSEATLSNSIWLDTTCPGGTNSSAYTPQTCVGH